MIEEMNTPTGDKKIARRLEQGLTLVPYYARNKRGERCAYCAWVELKHGESIAQAAKRFSEPAPEPQWTPELKANVEKLLREIQEKSQLSSSSTSAGTCRKES